MLTVDTILTHMRRLYGERFNSQWKTQSPEEMRQTWGYYVQLYSQEELKRGLMALMHHPFPPTMPEFFMLCRPRMDAEKAFVEAVNGLQARQSGRMGNWSHPAVFWAASTMAFDLLNRPYALIKEQWKLAYETALSRGNWAPVPEVATALPAPLKHSASPSASVAACQAKIAAMTHQILEGRTDPTHWIKRNLMRMQSGGKVPYPVRKMTLENARRMGILIPEGVSG